MHRTAGMLVAAIGTLSAPSANATIVISSDRGGLVSDYAARFLSARNSDELVVIDGPCLSACTLVVGMVPRDNVCATPKAVLGFHSRGRQARPERRGKPSDAGCLPDGSSRMDQPSRRPESEDDLSLRARTCCNRAALRARACRQPFQGCKAPYHPKLRRIRPVFPVRAKHYS